MNKKALISDCNGCSACVNTCPKNCINMIEDEEGFLYPKVDDSSCISCKKCEKVCPIINGNTKNQDSFQLCYAAYNADSEIRNDSSSGGIFTLLAEKIIENGGIVVGVSMSDDCKTAQHIFIDNVEMLERIRGSKYLQSAIGDCYRKTKSALNEGRNVFFTGTPCQIGGLLSFLEKDYPNLYTQDLICHGVPSPMVWRKYVEYLENKNAASARRVFFRNKEYGWKNFSLAIDFSNNSRYRKNFHDDAFMKGFLRNIFLRPSCYACAFKTLQRQADITLADFWGIQDVLPDLDDDKGISFVWIHSEKGKKLFDLISNQIVCEEVSFEEAIRFNSAAIKSCSPFAKREQFFKEIKERDFEQTLRNFCKRPLYKRIRSFIHRLVKVFKQ